MMVPGAKTAFRRRGAGGPAELFLSELRRDRERGESLDWEERRHSEAASGSGGQVRVDELTCR